MGYFVVASALFVRNLKTQTRRSYAECQNGSHEFHLPKWQNQLRDVFDAGLRYLTKSPQKTRSSAGSRHAPLQENTALLMRYFKTTSRIPERRAAAKLAGFAPLEEFGRDLLVLLALLREFCGDLHNFHSLFPRPAVIRERPGLKIRSVNVP